MTQKASVQVRMYVNSKPAKVNVPQECLPLMPRILEMAKDIAVKTDSMVFVDYLHSDKYAVRGSSTMLFYSRYRGFFTSSRRRGESRPTYKTKAYRQEQ